MDKKELLKLIYLYLFSAIGLILIINGSVRLFNLGLKTFIFKEADIYYFYPSIPSETEIELSPEELQKREELNRKSQRQREVSSALSMIFVGAPLYFYHWRAVLKNKKGN